MESETLRDAIRTSPFRPFQLELADGSRADVKHPEWIAFAGRRVAVVTDPDDRVHYNDLMLVTKIEVLPPVAAGSTSPGPNGGQ
jgi:hypothetical protein